MEDHFIITVNYKGQERDFEAVLHVTGYTHKFEVIVGESAVFYERDEEGSYRAILPAGMEEKRGKNIDIGLLKLIAAKIESILA